MYSIEHNNVCISGYQNRSLQPASGQCYTKLKKWLHVVHTYFILLFSFKHNGMSSTKIVLDFSTVEDGTDISRNVGKTQLFYTA